MNFLDLIQKVKAQGADTLAAPTFPFTPPGGTSPPANGTKNHTILLQADSASLNVGDTVKVRIYISSTAENISSFSVNIAFDPEFVRVIDADETAAGVQIDYIDTTFRTQTNTVNNSTGIINIRAEATTASALTRTVAEIEFLALKSGTTEIEIITGNSNIVNTNGVDLLEEANAISLNISTTTEEPYPTQPPTTPSIPNTGIQDHPSLIIGAASGILLIIVGLYLNKIGSAKNHKKQRMDGDFS